MKKLFIISSLLLSLCACEKENCGVCHETINGVIQPTLTRTVCTDEEEEAKRQGAANFNAANGTNFQVICDR